MTNESPEYRHAESAPEPQPAAGIRSSSWKYVLTVLITMLLTATLTISIGAIVLFGMQDKEPAESVLSLTFEDDEATRTALDKLKTVYAKVNADFYKEMTDAELLEAMTKGLADELGNRYTMYLTAEQYSQINEDMSGNYVGIGAFVALNKDGLVEITEVIAGGPAEEAGILPGDLFFEVDGTDVTAMNDTTSVVALVRGDAGTSVDIVMYRPSASKNVSFSVVRRAITTASVNSKMLTATIGYVQVKQFSAGVAENFINAVDALQAEGATDIIFDMRNNSGGYANEVISMLDYLLPEAVIASIKGRKDGKAYTTSWDSDAKMGVPANMRYAILINSMTASAAELFSGCLRDHDKALLIGEQTYGKGSGTQTFEMADGSAINLTTFLYYLPDGESIEEVGLAPDQAVTLPDEAAGKAISQLTLEQDTQLSAALKYLENLD